MNVVFRTYAAPAFLDLNQGNLIGNLGCEFLVIYSQMAKVCYNHRQPYLFPMYPKLHFLHHTFLRILDEGSEFGFSLSPMLTACQQDEDTIGKASRLSRRVSQNNHATYHGEVHYSGLFMLEGCWNVEAHAKGKKRYGRADRVSVRVPHIFTTYINVHVVLHRNM